VTTKAELAALEKVFAAEIEGRLPFQSNAKIFRRLCDEGFLEPMTRQFRPDRFGAIAVSGYQLSHAGRMTYCMSC
jgi:hypothetical protein